MKVSQYYHIRQWVMCFHCTGSGLTFLHPICHKHRSSFHPDCPHYITGPYIFLFMVYYIKMSCSTLLIFIDLVLFSNINFILISNVDYTKNKYPMRWFPRSNLSKYCSACHSCQRFGSCHGYSFTLCNLYLIKSTVQPLLFCQNLISVTVTGS